MGVGADLLVTIRSRVLWRELFAVAVAVAVIVIVEITELYCTVRYNHMESMRQCITVHLLPIFGTDPVMLHESRSCRAN